MGSSGAELKLLTNELNENVHTCAERATLQSSKFSATSSIQRWGNLLAVMDDWADSFNLWEDGHAYFESLSNCDGDFFGCGMVCLTFLFYFSFINCVTLFKHKISTCCL